MLFYGFKNRIGSTVLSDIVRGLIGTLRGDDQQMYFRMLAFDMRQMEQSNLKKEAAKRPKTDAEVFYDDAVLYPSDLCCCSDRGGYQLSGRIFLT